MADSRTVIARTHRAAAAGLVLSLALLVTGCTASQPDDADPTTSGPEASEQAGTEDEAEEGALPELGTATATLEDGTVDVVVRSLEADDNGTTMTLRVAFVPHLDGDEGASYTLSKINGFFFLHPVLLDRQNLKRYSVITGEGTQDWLTNADAETTDGEPLESWFVYAAPEDPIDTITFTIDEWGVEIPDIPIEAAP